MGKASEIVDIQFNSTWMLLVLIPDNFISIAGTTGGGFCAGMLMGWALKKIIKLFAIIAGLFLTGLAYLQYQHIASINWVKIEQASGELVNGVVNATKMIDRDNPAVAELAITSFGIPFTSSMSVGFTIGFMKG